MDIEYRTRSWRMGLGPCSCLYTDADYRLSWPKTRSLFRRFFSDSQACRKNRVPQ